MRVQPYRLLNWYVGMFLVTSPIFINMPTRTQLAVETITSFVPWLANLNIKRNVTSMFVNKKYRYTNSDRMHKWRPKKYSFVYALIRLTSLVCMDNVQKKCLLKARLVSLISA